MADPATSPPLQSESIKGALKKISPYIHRTPLLTSNTLNKIASSPHPLSSLDDDNPTSEAADPSTSSDKTNANLTGPTPKFNLYFKCENLQKIGAFKARGAFHAIIRLIESLGIDEVRKRGVVTHSSGNHAQALALAAKTFNIPAYIVMPRISTSSKIAGTRAYTNHVIFSGSTSEEREQVVKEVQEKTGAILVPPYDHPDIVLGQGTVGLEMEEQLQELFRDGPDNRHFHAVIAPIGGGGLLGGIATWFGDSGHHASASANASASSTSGSGSGRTKTKTKVFGAEPSFQGADDARRGVEQGQRITSVKSLTIADGLRTPVGIVNWGIVSDKDKVQGFYSVTEDQIKMTMRLVFERLKLVVEPSGCVPLAVLLFNQDFRKMVAEQQQQQQQQGEQEPQEPWDVGIVFSGGNTTMKAIVELFQH